MSGKVKIPPRGNNVKMKIGTGPAATNGKHRGVAPTVRHAGGTGARASVSRFGCEDEVRLCELSVNRVSVPCTMVSCGFAPGSPALPPRCFLFEPRGTQRLQHTPVPTRALYRGRLR